MSWSRRRAVGRPNGRYFYFCGGSWCGLRRFTQPEHHHQNDACLKTAAISVRLVRRAL